MNKKIGVMFLVSKSNLEILKILEENKKPLRFDDFKKLKNPKTGKHYSTRTINESREELIEKNLIKNDMVKKRNRAHVGYSITKKGSEALKIFMETQEKYSNLEDKNWNNENYLPFTWAKTPSFLLKNSPNIIKNDIIEMKRIDIFIVLRK